MRRALVIAPAVALFMLVTGTAFADKPTREVTPVDVTVEDGSCGFTVLLHETGTIVRITRVKHGETTFHETYPDLKLDLTNDDPRQVFTFDFDKVPFWKALDEIGKLSGLNPQMDDGDRRLDGPGVRHAGRRRDRYPRWAT